MSHSTFAERLKEAMQLRNLKSSQIEKISEQLFNENKIKRPIKMPVITDYLKGRYEAAQQDGRVCPCGAGCRPYLRCPSR